MRYSNDDIEAITELVALHLRFHTYQMGWTDSAVRRYVRDAGTAARRAQRLDRGATAPPATSARRPMLSRADGRARGRIAELAEREELASIRPELDGTQVMAQLGDRTGAARRQGVGVPVGDPFGRRHRWAKKRFDDGSISGDVTGEAC